MAQNGNDFNSSVSALLNGLEGFATSRTVVGEPVKVNDTIIIPLVDMKFGIGAGAFAGDKKDNAAGGMGATINPCAVLVIQNGMTKLINVRNQDIPSRLLDMVPDLINRFTGKDKKDPEVDKAVDSILHEEKKDN